MAYDYSRIYSKPIHLYMDCSIIYTNMGKDRTVIVEKKINQTNLFCNVILKDNSDPHHTSSDVTGLSKGEAKEIYKGLGNILGGEEK